VGSKVQQALSTSNISSLINTVFPLSTGEVKSAVFHIFLFKRSLIDEALQLRVLEYTVLSPFCLCLL
jgi:hypothetical protein